MKKKRGLTQRNRTILFVVLLALLCVGAAELAACRHFAPDTYERLTQPFRQAAVAAAEACVTAVEQAGRFCWQAGTRAAELIDQAGRQAAVFWEELTAPPPEPSLVVEESMEPDPSDQPSAAPVTDPPHTEVLESDGRQILTGGNVRVVYFCQADEAWADQLYGTDPIGPYGCGPTAMAMAVASMTDTDTDPAQMAAWAADHGYWAKRSGSYHSIVKGIARSFGLEAEAFTGRTPEELCRALRSNDILVALMGPGHFTTGGHFILLRGVTLSGQVLVADPNSLERSLEAWDPQLVLDELSSARDNGAPLWRLSVPNT